MSDSIKAITIGQDVETASYLRAQFADKEQVQSSGIGLLVAVTLVAVAWFSSLDAGQQTGLQSEAGSQYIVPTSNIVPTSISPKSIPSKSISTEKPEYL